MNLTIEQTNVLYKLYPNVVRTVGDRAFDVDNNQVQYDLSAVNAKVAQDEADKIVAEQAQTTAKASALAKLTALGLTQDEVKALIS